MADVALDGGGVKELGQGTGVDIPGGQAAVPLAEGDSREALQGTLVEQVELGGEVGASCATDSR